MPVARGEWVMMHGGSQWEPRGLSVSIIAEPKALTWAKE